MVQFTKKLLNRVEKVSYIYGPLDTDPLEMLKHFWTCNSLNEYSRQLQEWHEATYLAGFTGQRPPTRNLAIHRMSCHLVNIAWLLSKMKMAEPGDRSHWANSHSNLIVDSLRSLKVIFKRLKPATFHQLLYNWLYDSLKETELKGQGTDHQALFEHLQNIVMCCHHINENLLRHQTKPIAEQAQFSNEHREHAAQLGNVALNLFANASPAKINKCLRKLLIDYMLFNAGTTPDDIIDILDNYHLLCDFLDTATEKLNQTV